MTKRVNFSAFSGDDVLLKFTITDADNAGAPKSLTGATLTWAFAPAQGSAATITKTSPAGGIEITSEANGLAEVSIDAADTLGVAGGTYYHELQVVDSGGDTATAAYGNVILLNNTIA